MQTNYMSVLDPRYFNDVRLNACDIQAADDDGSPSTDTLFLPTCEWRAYQMNVDRDDGLYTRVCADLLGF